MKILEIFTGGTIGSSVKDGYICADRDNLQKLIEGYNRMSSQEIELDIEEPYVILSENLDGDYLNRLIDCIKKHFNDANSTYAGIIVTHGTDTLQYTAAALGYVFADSPIPIVLVSSNYILSDERANGLDNFYYAVEFIQHEQTPGVFVSYRNEKGTHFIHRATRLLSHASYSDLIYSAGNQFYGSYIKNHKVMVTTENTNQTEDKPTGNFAKNSNYYAFASNDENGNIPVSLFTDVHFTKLSHIMFLQAFPGQSYPPISEDTKAVLLESYHSGTLCTDGEELKAFMAQAREKNIPVFLTGVENRIGYESTKFYDELGIRVLPKASPIAMYMKLWLIASAGMDYEKMMVPVGDDFVELGQ